MLPYKEDHLDRFSRIERIRASNLCTYIGETYKRTEDKPKRNAPCPCGCGQKTKKCKKQ